LPNLYDLAGGVATYDERFWLKRPDWTFADADAEPDTQP
jgi:hypothetical protein